MEHGIVPKQIVKSTEAILGQTSVIELAAEQADAGAAALSDSLVGKGAQLAASPYAMNTPAHLHTAAEGDEGRSPSNRMATENDGEAEEEQDIYNPAQRKASVGANKATPFDGRSKEQLRKAIREAQRKMQTAAKEMDFLAAARYRDEIREMQSALKDARGE